MSAVPERERLPAPSAPRARTRLALRLGGIAAGVACAVAAFVRVDLSEVGRSLSGADAWLLCLAAAANLGSLAAHAGRWRAVLHAPGFPVRRRDAFAALVAGFAAGIVLPARGGDLLRAHLLARRAGLPTSSVLASSGLDYVVGTIPLVALLAALVASAPLPPWVSRTLWITAAFAAAGAAAAFALSPRSRATGHVVAGLVARLRAGLAAARAPRALLEALAWAVAGWAMELAIALATLAALGLPATFTAAALAVVAASAAAAAGLAPGNAGSFELATALALGAAGVPREPALAFAVAFHLAHLVPVALLGGALLLRAAVAGRRS
ncbi:MAG TPA: lysylphosphatidylglycerol synthase domain-containing protein [Anaeromyxobacter sp.]